MYQIAKPLFLYCETPLHAGSGSELGIVDLPIQRERHTGFPKIESSSLKGAIRERFEQVLGVDYKSKSPQRNDLEAVFGPESDSGDLYAGAIGFTDARLLLFPVKSMKGVFAWVTCPMVLERFWSDMKTAGFHDHFGKKSVPVERTTCNTPSLRISGSNIVLEAYKFTPESKQATQDFADWLKDNAFIGSPEFLKTKIGNDIVVLSNNDFTDFVNLSTEVVTRTQIDNRTGTVKDGALFTEEYLPAESLMYSLVLAAPVLPGKEYDGKDEGKRSRLSNGSHSYGDVMNYFQENLQDKAGNRIQLGANATLGKGLIQTVIPS